MKFTLATLALASVAYSQTIASETAMLPACALTCLAPAITASGCGLTDYACQCGTANAAIAQSATPCIITGCSSDDALKTQSITSEICVLANAMASGSSSAASSAQPASSSMASSMAASSTGIASSVSSSASSVVASATSKASSVVASATSKASSVAASATSTASPAAATTNGGSRESVGALVAGAAVLVAFAL